MPDEFFDSTWLNRKRVAKPVTKLVVLGVAEIDQQLADFPDNVRKRLIKRAIKPIAEKVMQEAQATAPRDQQGRIAAAMKIVSAVKRGRKGAAGKIGLGVRVGEGWFIGQTFFAGFLEFGTKPRFTKAGKYVGRIPQYTFDFLRKALWNNKQDAISMFASGIREELSRAARLATNKVLRQVGLNSKLRKAKIVPLTEDEV